MFRLQRELIAANSRIAQQEQELAETRVIKHTIDQALGPPSEAEFDHDATQQDTGEMQSFFNASAKGFNQDHDPWMQDDAKSDISESFAASAYNTDRNLWGMPSQATFGIQGPEKAFQIASPVMQSLPDATAHPWLGSNNTPHMQSTGFAQQHRVFSGPSTALEGRYAGEHAYMSGMSLGPRRSVSQMNRAPAYFQSIPSTWAAFGNTITNNATPKAPLSPAFSAYQQIGLYQMPQYQPRPIGTPLSPTAAEFTSSTPSTPSWQGVPVSRRLSSKVNPNRLLIVDSLGEPPLQLMSCLWNH